jgi:hypothetical protein
MDISETIILLTTQGYSDSYIAKLFNISSSNIAQRRRKLGIVKSVEDQKRSQALNFKYQNIFEMEEIYPLIGTLLGDGWLTKSSVNSYHGGVGHSPKQYCYLEYKYNLLKNIVTKGGILYKKTKGQHLNAYYIEPSELYYMGFKSSPYLYKLYQILYKNGKKVITEELLQYFSELSLALFYFDDGYKLTKGGLSYRIVNYDFDHESRVVFKKFLKDKFDLECTIQKVAFSFSRGEAIKFRDIISKYAPECVLYKI